MRDANGNRLRPDQALRAKQEQLARDPEYVAAMKIFRTPEGAKVLSRLGALLDGDDLIGDSPEETWVNLGARLCFRALRNMATLVDRVEARLEDAKERTGQ